MFISVYISLIQRGNCTLTLYIEQYKPSSIQTLLQNKASAAFFNAQLSGTEWRVSDVSAFLTKVSEDQRPAGSAYTWRDVFNETDQAIQTISRFMEVSVLVQDASQQHTQHTVKAVCVMMPYVRFSRKHIQYITCYDVFT